MHVEKKICDMGTLLDISGKTKDNDKTRLDFEDMGFQRKLHLIEGDKRWIKPHIVHIYSSHDRRSFCAFLKTVKFLDSYAMNILRNIVTDQG